MNEQRSRMSIAARGTTVALIGAMAGILLASGATLAITPTSGSVLAPAPVTINASTGDQADPHVSGDIAAYTDVSKIRYYQFLSQADSQVPSPADDVDTLSDVSNGKIVFSRVKVPSGSTAIMVYDITADATVEIAPQDFSFRIGSAIGSDTVAFVDLLASQTGELYAAQIGGAGARITDDASVEQRPSVSPLGDRIVFESCSASSLTNCDVHLASLSGGAWTVTVLAATAEPEGNPDTDGVTVVYDATRSGESDVYWQPVGGGSELPLDLPGQQRNPAISAGVIAFEGVAVGESAADLYVYELATNRLFQVTSTAGVDESLNDIVVLPDGSVRVVWASAAGTSLERDIYGATFTIPPVEPPTFTFGGFLQPVDPLPTLNSMKAGGAVPVKFSLGGDHGLDIFAGGYPKSQAIACDSSAPLDGIEQTVTSGGSSLAYDALIDLYTYVWKTDKAWAGTCRQLVLTFSDNSTARANFNLK